MGSQAIFHSHTRYALADREPKKISGQAYHLLYLSGANFYFNHFAYRYVAGLPHSPSDATLSDGGASPKAPLSSPTDSAAVTENGGASPPSTLEPPQLAETKGKNESGSSLIEGAENQGLLPLAHSANGRKTS